MRIQGSGLLAVLAITFLAANGMSQYCPTYYGGPSPSYNMMPPSPYPAYQRYGVWPVSYYPGQVPPYLAGGPAPGYTYPYPWSGYNPYPGTRSYIAPPYPQPQPSSPYAYTASYRPSPPPVVTYYSPNPQSYMPARSSSGSKFATDSTRSASPPAKTVSATKTAPAKKAWTSSATKEISPFSADQQQAKDKKPSLLSKLLFWQKSKD